MSWDLQEERWASICDRMDAVKKQHEFFQKRKDSLNREIDDLQEEITMLEKVEELFKHLLDENIHQYAESFSEIVTEGLSYVFHDQNLTFQVNVEKKHGGIWVEFETASDEVTGQPIESFGGGVLSVESLILRILVLMEKDLSRYLILDESLGALSEEYIDQMSKFISQMSERFDVDILLVTHNDAFLDHADTVYRARQKKGVEKDTLILEDDHEG